MENGTADKECDSRLGALARALSSLPIIEKVWHNSL
jgi:hypothetical protein